MMGLPFSWEERDPGPDFPNRKVITYSPGYAKIATKTEADLIDRVEALSEAAERARLILNALPGRMDAAGTSQGIEAAFETLHRELNEAEAALFYVLKGRDPRLSDLEPNIGVSEHSEGD